MAVNSWHAHLLLLLFTPSEHHKSPFCLSHLSVLSVTEDSAGLKRILSQSTESLNFRSRTLSMESLTDDGLSVTFIDSYQILIM